MVVAAEAALGLVPGRAPPPPSLCASRFSLLPPLSFSPLLTLPSSSLSPSISFRVSLRILPSNPSPFPPLHVRGERV